MHITIGNCTIAIHAKIAHDVPSALRDLAKDLDDKATGGAIKEAFGDRAPEVAKDFMDRAEKLRHLAGQIEENL